MKILYSKMTLVCYLIIKNKNKYKLILECETFQALLDWGIKPMLYF